MRADGVLHFKLKYVPVLAVVKYTKVLILNGVLIIALDCFANRGGF